MVSSLRTRLMLAAGILAAAAVAAVAVAARQGARREFVKFQDEERRLAFGRADERALPLAAELSGRCCAPGDVDAAARRLERSEALVIIDDATGRAVAVAGAPLASLSDLDVRRDGRDGLTIEASRGDGSLRERVRLAFHGGGAPLALADGRAARLHIVPFPAAEEDSRAALFLGSLDRRLLIAAAVVGAVALAVLWTLAGRIIGPIRELRSAARALGEGRPATRIVPRGSDEIADLARGFNFMMDELQRQEALRRRLLHDVSHELRTPLTALRCRIETLVDGLSGDPQQTLRGAQEELLHLGKLVDDLHVAALAEARELPLVKSRADVAAIVESAARAAGLEADPRLRLAVPAGLAVHADAVRTRQVVLNLLTNADRHTPRGGEITVRGAHEGGSVVVEVRNSGSTLTPDELEHVFDRFYRADPSRQRATGGSGLGLAIVKNLVEAQGGRAWAAAAEGGVSFSFTLPGA
jgi:signal transduction histidine kinase